MDVLKACIYVLVVTMSVNVILLMMNDVGMTTITPLNTTQWNEAFNATRIVNSWGWSDNPFYDIATGLTALWYGVRKIIEGVPMMMEAAGAPAFIYERVYLIYRALWLIAVSIGIIAGRQT